MTEFDNNRNLTHQVTYTLGIAIVRGDYPVGEAVKNAHRQAPKSHGSIAARPANADTAAVM